MLAVIRIFQTAALAALLQGCFTAANLGLLGPTDLSGLEPGMTAAEVNEILGDPDKSETVSGGRIERFTYDRGYKNPRSEEINPVFYYGVAIPVSDFLILLLWERWGFAG